MHDHLIVDPVYILRSAGGYVMTLLIVRLMGKRSIGELGPFDFVLMAGIGDIMAFTIIEKKVPFHHGAIILGTLAIVEIILSKVTLKSKKMASIIEGTPTVLIEDGKLIKKNMEKEKISYYDIRKELRNHGISDESIVKKGTIESCGKFTIILNDDQEPVTKGDLEIYGEGSTSQYMDKRFSDVRNEIDRLNTTLNNLIIEVRKTNNK